MAGNKTSSIGKVLSGALNKGVLRLIHSLELRQTAEGDEDEDFKIRQTNTAMDKAEHL